MFLFPLANLLIANAIITFSTTCPTASVCSGWSRFATTATEPRGTSVTRCWSTSASRSITKHIGLASLRWSSRPISPQPTIQLKKQQLFTLDCNFVNLFDEIIGTNEERRKEIECVDNFSFSSFYYWFIFVINLLLSLLLWYHKPGV